MKKLFTILALALAMVACQKDGNVEEFSNGDLALVTLNLDAPALGVTRAGDNGQDDATNGKESAYGAIDYADAKFWAKYDLRYILEVYSAEDNGTGENIARERLYSFKDEYAPTEFQVRLVPNRTYKFVVWADFVLEGTQADLYYNTANLRAISAITTGDWNAMNEARDAYFVSQNLDIKKDVAQNLTLKRPLAKIRVVTTDKEHWTKYSQPSRVEVKYYESELSNVFNAVNGQIDTTQPLQKLTYDVVYDDAESQYNETVTHKTLFTDYLFVKPAPDQTPIHFTMDVYEGDNHDVLVRSNDFCTEIPIKRNHLTTIYGDILTTMSDITVGINDNFDLEVNVDYNEDEHSNDAGNSAPVLKPEGENAEGVTEVSYANGAYTIATAEGIDVNIKVSALTEGKLAAGVYTYGVDFTVDDFDYAVPATASKFNQTAAATVKAKVVGGTMEVLYKTSGEQVINLELNITYKANETDVEATAAYTMTSKFEFAEIKQVVLDTPVVEATVSENTVTLTWASVENAVNYSITVVGTETSVSTEECTYTFTGEYDTDYVFSVVAVPADELLYLPSAAAKVEARTAAEVTDDPQPEVKTYYVYVDEQNGWSHVYLYAWWGDAKDECIVGWPGTELTATKNIDGVVYLVYAIPAEHNGKTLQFIVNNGEDKQTPNSEQYLINNDVFLTVEAEEIVVPDKPWEPAANELIFVPNSNWTQANARFAAYFFNNGEKWVNMTLVPGKTNMYYVEVPTGFKDVIFVRMNPASTENNWNQDTNKWNQTSDLKVPTDGNNMYTLAAGSWDKGNGSWSKYTVDYTPTKLNAPRVNAAVEGNVVTLSWNAVTNAEYYTVNDVKAASPYVFEGEYNTPYTFSVVSCSDDARFAASDAVVVEVTTEAEAVVEPTVVALDAPEVTVSVDVNVVTLTWEAVAGASHYTVQVDDDVEEVVNATSYVFEGDYEVEYMFTVKAIAADTTVNTDSEATIVKATTEAKPSDAPAAGSELTVAEFLALANADNEYVLTGKITRVVNTVYGNFDLTDATGTIYVYGLLTPDGVEKTQWAAEGLREGDTITIKGKYSEYNGDPQISKAVYISHVAAPFVSADAITINATDLSAVIEVKSNVAWTVSCDDDWVSSYTKSGQNNGEIIVEVSANASTSNRTATFTLVGEGVEAVSVTVTLTQYGAGATDTKGTYTNEDFFKNNSVSTNSKAVFEKVNIDGVSYDCLKLGTSSVTGKYTSNAVGESGDLTLSFYALGWNGKTSKLNVYLDGNKVADAITLTANSGAANNTPYTVTPSDTTDYYTINLTGVTETSTITFETVSGACRALIFGVQLY